MVLPLESADGELAQSLRGGEFGEENDDFTKFAG